MKTQARSCTANANKIPQKLSVPFAYLMPDTLNVMRTKTHSAHIDLQPAQLIVTAFKMVWISASMINCMPWLRGRELKGKSRIFLSYLHPSTSRVYKIPMELQRALHFHPWLERLTSKN